MNTQETKTYQELIETESEIDWDSKEFWNIVRFYLLECPTVKTVKKEKRRRSCRGQTLEEYGWGQTTPLKNSMTNSSLNLTDFTSCGDVDIKEFTKEFTPPTEYCVVKKKDPTSANILTYIRDSLAHGNFYIVTCEETKIYIFKNVNTNTKEQNAEIVLYEETLLNWIQVIKAGPAAKKK